MCTVSTYILSFWRDSRTGNGRCIFGKTLYAYFPLRPSNLPVVVAQAVERLANRTQKCGQIDAQCLVYIRMNEFNSSKVSVFQVTSRALPPAKKL